MKPTTRTQTPWRHRLRLPLALAVAGALAAAAYAADEMTVVSWGGAYSYSQERAYIEPYETANPGVAVIRDESAAEGVAKLRAMNEAGNVTWDVLDAVASDAIRLCDEGLVIEIDPDRDLEPGANGASASADFGDLLVTECFIPQIIYSTTFGYRTDIGNWGGKQPDDICDVFDLDTFPGRRALQKAPINNLEWALLCDGVAKDDLYDVLATPAGQQRAFAKLDSIKDEVIWWSAGAEPAQLLADKEVVLASAYNGRLFSLIEEKDQPVAYLWDAQVYDLDGWVIPAGLPPARMERAKDFVRFATSTQRLADQAKYISYAPARESSVPLVGKHAELGIEMGKYMPNHPDNAGRTILFNYTWWADYRDDLDARFQAWLSS